MKLIPITLRDAMGFVDRNHSHLPAPVGGIFAVGIEGNGSLVCVAILGRPVARNLCDGFTAEVTRVASDRTTKNAASKAIGAITRAALAVGYTRLVSYTMLGEPGTVYIACGWKPVAISKGGQWARPSRHRSVVS